MERCALTWWSGRAGLRRAEQVLIIGVPLDPLLHERALRHHPEPSTTAYVVQHAPRQRGADAAALVGVVDLGVLDDDPAPDSSSSYSEYPASSPSTWTT